MIRPCFAVGLLLLAAACDNPSDYLPKEPEIIEARAMPRAEAVQLVRDIVGPCERAMEKASDAIGVLAAAGPAPPASQETVALTKAACATAFVGLQRSAASGEVRDACLAAAYARESVADTALEILSGRGTPVTVSTLQYKAADQASASRACVSALARAGAASIPLRP